MLAAVCAQPPGSAAKWTCTATFVLKLHITSLSEEALTEEEYNEYLNQSQEILSDCLSSYQHYYIARGTQDCFVVICAAGEAPITALCKEAVNIVGSLAQFSAVHWHFQLQ